MVEVGATVMLAVLAPVFHWIVPVPQPLAVRVASWPTQIAVADRAMVRFGTIPSSTTIGTQPLAGQSTLAVVVKL